jgi:hypothetical protein
MVAYIVSFKFDFDLHLRERRSMDWDSLFNDAEDMERNKKDSRIQLKTIQDPPKRIYFQDIRKFKKTKTP